MSNAPKMTCPGDPRAQTHTQIVRAYLSEVCKITHTIQNRFDMRGRVRTIWQDAWMTRRRRSSWTPPKWYVVFLEEKIYTTDQKLVNTSTHAYLRDSPDKSAWVRGRRGVPAVAADLSFHLYMHKKTNKRQHRWAKCTKWARCAKLHAQYKTVLIWGEGYVPHTDKMCGWQEGDDHHGRRRSDMLFF